MTRAEVVQPVPCPRTPAAYFLLVLSGVLVDLAGRPITPGVCPTCEDHDTLGQTCPADLPCPDCSASPGERCRLVLGETGRIPERWHRIRWEHAEALDDDRAAAGDLAVPAPWPDRPNRLRSLPGL